MPLLLRQPNRKHLLLVLAAAAVARLRDAPGMILDLRGNPGGSGQEMDAIAALFLDGKTAAYRAGQRTGATPARLEPHYVGSAGGAVYRRPVVIPVNEPTGSSSELLASSFQECGRARVVGSVSSGSVIGVNNSERLPGGAELDIGAVLLETMHGEKLDGRGVIPDIRAEPTLADVRAQRDVLVEVAERALRRGNVARPAGVQ